MNKDVSVLIYSCDKYADVWGPFFTLFFRYWKCPYRVYITAETEQCLIPEVKTINVDAPTWSERIRSAVEQIESKYVIGMCEDFFFRKNVRQDIIDNCLMYMETDENIGCFNFEKECEPGIQLIPSKYLDFAEKPAGSHFQKSCQPTLWRKKYLEELLACELDAWNWEWQEREYPLKHYIWNGLLSQTAFDYGLHDRNLFGIVQGKWFKPDVEPLFKKENIDIDLSIRGTIE